MARVLFHIDLNAFFASAEELRHPEYKGKPLAVGSLSNRGVIATANYEARNFGVHSAMPTVLAKEKCPELILLPGDHDYYHELSRKFFSYLRTYSLQLEPVSIDECFLDVTETIKKYPRPMDLAVDIQQGVLQELGLRCSIGVAPNRFLAKMASDMQKPMGLTILRKSEIARKLWPLEISKMQGVGVKSLPRFEEMGIHTIGDLAAPENEEKILKRFGKSGWKLIRRARGEASDQLCVSTSRKSVSISTTVEKDLYTLEEVLQLVDELCLKLARRLSGRSGKLVSLVFRDTAFHNSMHSVSLKQPTNRYETLRQAAQWLATENFEPIGYRHIGISVGSLSGEQPYEQPSLFEPQTKSSDDIIARLNQQLGTSAFGKASDLLKKSEEQEEKHAA